MADRDFSFPKTQGRVHVYMSLILKGQGAGKAPILGEGDVAGSFVSQPVRTGTGTFTLTTQNGYPAVVNYDVLVSQATPAATTTAFISPPVQNANGSWTFSFAIFPSGVAGDVAATDQLAVQLVLRNSGSLP